MSTTIPETEQLYIEQDGDQFNDLWLACAVIFGVIFGFFLGVMILFIIRKRFPAKYTKADAQRLAESGLQQDPAEELPTKQADPDTYSEIVPNGVAPEPTVLTASAKKPLSWVRRQSTVDLGDDEVNDGVIDALAQDTLAQMQMALVSQEFTTISHWEGELQGQYRTIFLNLINIYLDSLVQQKVIEAELKQEMSSDYSARLNHIVKEWKDKLFSATQEYERDIGDAMLSPHLEEMRYEAAMEMEDVMLEIRESLRKTLVTKTTLKTEEIDFMEEKLVENLTMLCEIINGEYVSISKAQTGRYEVAKKVGTTQFSHMTYESEEAEQWKEKFKAMMVDLKNNHKLSGSLVTKLQKTFDERITATHIKFNEEFQHKLHDQLEKSARYRVQELKKIKSWKRSTEIASTANQSYQAAVDGLIEPSRYIQTIHELQTTVRLDKMLALKRIDTKEGDTFEKLLTERVDGKSKEYLSILSDAIGTCKLEKNMDANLLDQKSKAMQEALAQHKGGRVNELRKKVVTDIESNEKARETLDREFGRQSADQEELLGEQEDAVREVLQTQSGLTELDREQMMAVHQHQALAVINMLFMNRLRIMKKVEMTRIQDKNEIHEYEKKLVDEMTNAIGPAGSKGLSKKQTKLKLTTETKNNELLTEMKKDKILSGDDAVNIMRQGIYDVTVKTLKQFDERMGDLLAKLQVNHAKKEGSKVKTSQVLNKIKTRLVDMIWMDGYVPEATCKKILQEHHKIVQDVTEKFSQKRENNTQMIEKTSDERQQKRESELKAEIDELVEGYKSKENSKYQITQPLWENWAKSKQQIETHNSGMELSRQIQDLYNSIEYEFADDLKDEEINIILELVKMGRMDVNEFDSIIKTSVTACVGGDKLYKELSKPLLERFGTVAKRADKANMYWEIAKEKTGPSIQTDPKVAAERAANVWRARLGIYDDKKR